MRGKPLSWEAVNFRGMDMDTADLQITGFGERKLVFGEGPATKRYACGGQTETNVLQSKIGCC